MDKIAAMLERAEQEEAEEEEEEEAPAPWLPKRNSGDASQSFLTIMTRLFLLVLLLDGTVAQILQAASCASSSFWHSRQEQFQTSRSAFDQLSGQASERAQGPYRHWAARHLHGTPNPARCALPFASLGW